MKSITRIIVLSTLLITPVTTATLSGTIQQVEAATIQKVMWGKTELIKGQLGKVTILNETPLVSINTDGSLKTLRTLKKGDEFRVYSYKSQNGGLYGVGGGSFVQLNGAKVKYDTPSKSKLAQLSAIQNSANGGSSVTQEVSGIKVLYGDHTYGSNHQAEYDAVIKAAKEAYVKHQHDPETIEYLDRYIAGERSDGTFVWPSAMLELIGNSFGGLIKNGVSREEILKLIKIGESTSYLGEEAKDPLDGTPRSAYDAIVRKLTDCDPQAHILSLAFDMHGYSTMIIAGNNHANFYVKIHDNWYEYGAGTFLGANEMVSMKSPGTYILAKPTC